VCWININQLSCFDLVALDLDLAIFLHMSGMAASGGHIRSALFTPPADFIFFAVAILMQAGEGVMLYAE